MRYYLTPSFSGMVIRDRTSRAPSGSDRIVASQLSDQWAPLVCNLFNDLDAGAPSLNDTIIREQRGRIERLQKSLDEVIHDRDVQKSRADSLQAALVKTQEQRDAATVDLYNAQNRDAVPTKTGTDGRKWVWEANSAHERLDRIGAHLENIFERLRALELKK